MNVVKMNIHVSTRVTDSRSWNIRTREDLNITCSVQVVALFSKELATFSSPHVSDIKSLTSRAQ